ncbi:MAG: hypothetical protein ACIAS6_05235 [Phycisphaerales bacterium JB060]
MRPRRAIATLLVFVLLGALATVLSSWAIQSWHHWRMAQTGTLTRNWSGATFTAPSPDDPPIDLSSSTWRAHRRVPPGPVADAVVRARGSGVWERERFAWRFCLRALSGRGQPSGADGGEGPFIRTRERLMLVEAGWPRRAMAVGAYAGWFGVDDAPTFFATPARELATSTPTLSLHGGFDPLGWRAPAMVMPGQTIATRNPVDRFALPLLPLWPGFLINTLFYALLLFSAWRLPGVLRRVVRRRRGRCVGCGYDRGGLDPDAACPECGAHVGHRSRRSGVAG